MDSLSCNDRSRYHPILCVLCSLCSQTIFSLQFMFIQFISKICISMFFKVLFYFNTIKVFVLHLLLMHSNFSVNKCIVSFWQEAIFNWMHIQLWVTFKMATLVLPWEKVTNSSQSNISFYPPFFNTTFIIRMF